LEGRWYAWRRAVNRGRYGVARRLGCLRGRVHHKPLRLVMFVTLSCPLSCRWCPFSEMSSRAVVQLGPVESPPASLVASLKKVLNRYPTIETLELTGGEPLLHQGIWAATRTAAARNVAVNVSTNGVLVLEHLSEMAAAPMSHVNVSLNAVNAAEYGEITGADDDMFDRVCRGISEIVRLRKKNPILRRISVSWVCHRANYHRIPAAIGLAEELGVDEADFYNLIPYGSGGFDVDKCLYTDDRDVIQLLGSIPAPRGNLEVVLPRLYPRRRESIPCTQPFTTLVVYPDDSVAPCCVMLHPRVGRATGAGDVWNDVTLRRWREQLLEGNGPPGALCHVCPWSVTEYRPAYVPVRQGIR